MQFGRLAVARYRMYDPPMASDHQPEPPFSEEEAPDGHLVPWEPQGLSAEPSEVEDLARVEDREELAERLVERPHPTAMLDHFGRILRFIASFLFAHVEFERRSIDNIADASQRGTVVYVMRSRSLLDYLYFNWAFREHELPIARFSNGSRTVFARGFFSWLANLFRRSPSEKPEEQMQALVANDESVFLFLQRPKASPDENVEFSQKYLYRLVRAQRQSEDPIYILPMLLVWEKRPDSRHPTVLDEVFGTAQSPGFFRKFLNFFQTVWQSFLKFGQPQVQVSSGVDLKTFLREYPEADTADVSEMLRERLLDTLEQEQRVILGPTGEEPNTIWREMLHRPALTHTISEIAEEEGVEEEVIVKRAREQFDEIAAEPSLLMVKIFSSILSLVWYRIYDGFEVDEEGIENLREWAKTSNIVLVPSHKSHIDYLVLSYLFFRSGLTPPLIAAGINLSFWPMGYLFRRGGAFFLRRSFKGEKLYPVVFREYVIRILEEGYPLEFFIEGSRSRTGKLIKPKYGMLDMVVQAYTSGRLESVKIVPISVGYEKIIEESAYRQELLGGEKEKESLGGLLKAPKFLTSKYGRLYVEFADAIDLGDYLDKYEIDRLNPSHKALQNLNVRLAHRIIYDINEVTTVTPTALAATVLLNNESRGIERDRFLREVGFLLRFLVQPDRTSRLSRTVREALRLRSREIDALEEARAESTDAGASSSRLEAWENVPDVESEMGEAVSGLMDWAVEVFEKDDQLSVTRSDGDEFYSVPEEARVELSYYRNNIVHHFVPESLLAAAIRSFPTHEIPLDKLMEETLFLSRLFKYEWIYEERAEFRNVFLRTLNYFNDSGWLELDEADAMVSIDTPPPIELDFFRRLVLTFLEAYTIVASMLPEMIERPLEKSEITSRALKKARTDYLAGRILFHESLSKPTYENALRLLNDWGILTRQFNESKKRETYQVDPDWTSKLDELQSRLESFVYPDRR